MKTLKQSYHHGDLLTSLLSSASAIIKEKGVENLSMRKLADKVGVSRAAPYHHFKDKNTLLCALAEQGFITQQRDLKNLIIQQGHSHESFTNYVFMYLDYAMAHNEIYDLMFGRIIWRAGKPTGSLKSAAKNTFKTWIEWVELLQQAGVLSKQNTALRIGQSTWASLHGLSRLAIDGIYLNQNDISEMAEQLIHTHTIKQSKQGSDQISK